MFPVSSSGFARPSAQEPGRWVGIAVFAYADGRLLEEVVTVPGAPGQPACFRTSGEALRAALAYAQTFRLSNRTELLTGLYGGES